MKLGVLWAIGGGGSVAEEGGEAAAAWLLSRAESVADCLDAGAVCGPEDG